MDQKSIRRFSPAREFFLDHSQPKQTTPQILFNFYNSAFFLFLPLIEMLFNFTAASFKDTLITLWPIVV
eukprot:UN27885